MGQVVHVLPLPRVVVAIAGRRAGQVPAAGGSQRRAITYISASSGQTWSQFDGLVDAAAGVVGAGAPLGVAARAARLRRREESGGGFGVAHIPAPVPAHRRRSPGARGCAPPRSGWTSVRRTAGPSPRGRAGHAAVALEHRVEHAAVVAPLLEQPRLVGAARRGQHLPPAEEAMEQIERPRDPRVGAAAPLPRVGVADDVLRPPPQRGGQRRQRGRRLPGLVGRDVQRDAARRLDRGVGVADGEGSTSRARAGGRSRPAPSGWRRRGGARSCRTRGRAASALARRSPPPSRPAACRCRRRR